MPLASRGPIAGAEGIWRFASRFEVDVPTSHRITLGEGGTPCQEHVELARTLGLERLWLKREDLNPTGSHKDRGAAFQISALMAEAKAGDRTPGWLTISSSGNAAISAATYAAGTPLNLAVFVAPGMPPARLQKILEQGAYVIVSERAISLCAEFAGAHSLANLRPSTDPLAVIGFMSLGWELREQASEADSVFTFASSGTSLVAIGRAVEQESANHWPFSLHVVQGSSAHPIAAHFDRRMVVDQSGEVGAHGARKTRRLGEAVRLISRSSGSGWMVTDSEAHAASRLLDLQGINVAIESAASLAAAQRAAEAGRVRRAVVILTGARRTTTETTDALSLDLVDASDRPAGFESGPGPPPRLFHAESVEQVQVALGWRP